MAKDFTELHAWQLARELKMFVLHFVDRQAVRRDQKFYDQATDAAKSAPRNIAEGYGRFQGKQFANFLRIAIASELETRNNIIDAHDCGWLTDAEFKEGMQLTRRAITASVRLREYLLSDRNPFK